MNNENLNNLSGTIKPEDDVSNASSIEEEFNEDDLIEDSEEQVSATNVTSATVGEEEVSISEFMGQEYIKAPEVGESIEFTISSIVNNPQITGTNKTTGEEFTIGCKKKDGTVIRKDIITTNNERFTIGSWGLFYLFYGKNSPFAKKVVEKGTYKGIKVKIKRNYDGSVPNKKTADVMKLYDLPTPADAEAYKKEVAEAIKNGNLFTMEILE